MNLLNSTPSISIIVPVYQAERFLEESVKSILKQSFNNIEIILVDDGSTDRSGEICDNLASRDCRIRVIHQKNKGQSAARNVGIELSKGKYIAFMDNDDFLYPDMCETLFKNAEMHHADISAGSYIVQNEFGIESHATHSHKTHVYTNKQGLKEYLSREVIDIYVWTKIYKKEFINHFNLLFEEGRSEEDWLFNYSAFYVANKTVMTDVPIYLYIERTESTSRTIYKKALRKYLDDSCYRVNKIEQGVQLKYPDLLYLARRQSLIAYMSVIFVMSKYKREECEPYYSYIKDYMRKNANFLISNRKYWYMSWIGTILAAYLPKGLYFKLKQLKNRNIKL